MRPPPRGAKGQPTGPFLFFDADWSELPENNGHPYFASERFTPLQCRLVSGKFKQATFCAYGSVVCAPNDLADGGALHNRNPGSIAVVQILRGPVADRNAGIRDVGIVVGEPALRRAGVVMTSEGFLPVRFLLCDGFTMTPYHRRLTECFSQGGSVDYSACAFRLCPKLSYQARKEATAATYRSLRGSVGRDRRAEREAHEKATNEEEMSKVLAVGCFTGSAQYPAKVLPTSVGGSQ